MLPSPLRNDKDFQRPLRSGRSNSQAFKKRKGFESSSIAIQEMLMESVTDPLVPAPPDVPSPRAPPAPPFPPVPPVTITFDIRGDDVPCFNTPVESPPAPP